jgi:DNA-binding NtrC family response regulator
MFSGASRQTTLERQCNPRTIDAKRYGVGSGSRQPGDTTAPASSLGAGAVARVQQLHWVYAPGDDDGSHDRRGGERIERVTLDADELVLGREPVGARTLVIADKRASRSHAVLVRDRATGDLRIVDRESRHGTLVDGGRVEQAAIRHGSVIRLGDSIFILSDTLLRMEEAKALAPESQALRGKSIAMQRVRGEIALVAPRSMPVLVLGETGVGKERVAQEIHRQSGRSGALVAVNCAAIAPTLAETELFGHAAGAFTGATAKSDGVFVAADKGTLFLDEIAELPLPLQPKLLRALATGEVRPVGRAEPRMVDVRLVAATHGNLRGAVDDGGFRGDLLARLAGWTLAVPPLRDRREDIVRLARFVLERANPRLQLSAGSVEALLLWDWPFNVRELEQVLTAAAVRASDGIVRPEQLPEPMARPLLTRARTTSSARPTAPLPVLVSPDATPDAEGLREIVQRFDGNVARVADYFGKDRKQVYRWAEKLGVDLDKERATGSRAGSDS